VYESLWWLLGARLADMAIRRFIWVPLEETTGRRVPNIMKFIVSLLVYGCGVAGITAMVFNQTLTNLLATSGLLAMIIGLAVKDNIANVFSGIVLNVERPFKVGDYIKINNMTGQVKDITWRTTRIESNDGPMVSIANSRVSEALTENLSNVPHGISAETVFHTPAEVDHRAVLEIIAAAVAQSKSITCKDEPGFDPSVRYRGIINVNGRWVAAFSAGYRVANVPKKGKAREELWTYVREQFDQKGIPLIPAADVEAAVVMADGKPA
jgi:potassium-dependent mechanosensitive channel